MIFLEFFYFKHHIKHRIICDTIFLEYQGAVDLNLNLSYIYPDALKEIPTNTRFHKGKHVWITNFVDADHSHDIETRHSVTVVHMFVNKNPTQWYIRWYNIVVTSTYGLELVAMRVAMRLIMTMC